MIRSTKRFWFGPFIVVIAVACASNPAPSTAEGDQPAAGDAQPAAGVLKEGKPLGVFFMTRYWSYTQTLEKAGWYFALDGQVYQNLEHGAEPPDLKAHKAMHGTYRVEGDSMEITWSDGMKTKSKLEREPKSFAWDGGIFTPVEPIREKKSIAGNYDGGASLSHNKNTIAVAKTFQLRADGTYSMSGVTVVSGKTESSEIGGSAQKSDSGTWTASGYSMTLTPSSGPAVRYLAFPVDDDSTTIYPDHLYVGGTLFKKLTGK